MVFDWDENNLEHIARHGVTAHEVEELMMNDPLDFGRVLRNGEDRTVQVGITDDGRFLTVITAERGYKIRVVTAYDARRVQIAIYRQRASGDAGDA